MFIRLLVSLIPLSLLISNAHSKDTSISQRLLVSKSNLGELVTYYDDLLDAEFLAQISCEGNKLRSAFKLNARQGTIHCYYLGYHTIWNWHTLYHTIHLRDARINLDPQSLTITIDAQEGHLQFSHVRSISTQHDNTQTVYKKIKEAIEQYKAAEVSEVDLDVEMAPAVSEVGPNLNAVFTANKCMEGRHGKKHKKSFKFNANRLTINWKKNGRKQVLDLRDAKIKFDQKSLTITINKCKLTTTGLMGGDSEQVRNLQFSDVVGTSVEHEDTETVYKKIEQTMQIYQTIMSKRKVKISPFKIDAFFMKILPPKKGILRRNKTQRRQVSMGEVSHVFDPESLLLFAFESEVTSVLSLHNCNSQDITDNYSSDHGYYVEVYRPSCISQGAVSEYKLLSYTMFVFSDCEAKAFVKVIRDSLTDRSPTRGLYVQRMRMWCIADIKKRMSEECKERTILI